MSEGQGRASLITRHLLIPTKDADHFTVRLYPA